MFAIAVEVVIKLHETFYLPFVVCIHLFDGEHAAKYKSIIAFVLYLREFTEKVFATNYTDFHEFLKSVARF